MKSIVGILLSCLLWSSWSAHAQEAKPSLVMYISPNEYSHEVRLGLLPYYIVWARKGPALERAARTALQSDFGDVTMCEGSNGGDVIVWLQPQLNYSPPVSTYHAKVTAHFFRADGKPIGTLKATGTQQGAIGSRLVDTYVQQAFDHAMRDIAAQFTRNSALQQAIDTALPKTPCAMVALVPNP